MTLSFGGHQYNTFAMIDSGATKSFVNKSFLESPEILQVPKEHPVGHSSHRWATNIFWLSAPVTLSILGHEEVISLEITKLGNYPVILGLPWLSQHHPQVNWSDQSIVFASPYCLAQCLRHSGGSQQIRNSGNLSGSIASDTPPLNNSKSRRVTVPHTPASRQVTAANPYNSGPSQDISCERGSFPRSALKTALVYGVTSTPELNPHPAEDDDNSVSDIKSIQQSVPTR